MSLVFEWDSDKARTNPAKHGIGFDEASTVLSDVLSLTIPDRFIQRMKTGMLRLVVLTGKDF